MLCVLTDSAGRTLEIVSDRRNPVQALITTYIHSHVCPVQLILQVSGGFHEIANCNAIHHEAICALVGVHKFTSKLACQYQVGNLLYHTQM